MPVVVLLDKSDIRLEGWICGLISEEEGSLEME